MNVAEKRDILVVTKSKKELERYLKKNERDRIVSVNIEIEAGRRKTGKIYSIARGI